MYIYVLECKRQEWIRSFVLSGAEQASGKPTDQLLPMRGEWGYFIVLFIYFEYYKS